MAMDARCTNIVILVTFVFDQKFVGGDFIYNLKIFVEFLTLSILDKSYEKY